MIAIRAGQHLHEASGLGGLPACPELGGFGRPITPMPEDALSMERRQETAGR